MFKQRYVWLIFTVLILLYLGLSIGLPPDPHTLHLYHLTPTKDRVINLTVALPIVVISYVVLYGYSRLKRYALHIKKAPEGRGLLYVAMGLGYIAFSLPVSSLISVYANYLSQHNSHLVPTSVIINNYVLLGFTIAAFLLIGYGARAIYRYIKKPAHITTIHWLAIGVLIVSVIYSFLIVKSPYRQQPLPTTGRAIFYLPDWLILFTVVLPNVLMWYIGVVSGFYIYLYSKHVRGIIYKQALMYLAIGLESIIGAFMLIRFLSTITASLAHFSLAFILLLIYFLLIVISIGFILVALGARRLQKIEEV